MLTKYRRQCFFWYVNMVREFFLVTLKLPGVINRHMYMYRIHISIIVIGFTSKITMVLWMLINNQYLREEALSLYIHIQKFDPLKVCKYVVKLIVHVSCSNVQDPKPQHGDEMEVLSTLVVEETHRRTPTNFC